MAKHVTTLEVGAFLVNCYLYGDDVTGDAVIIDPGDEADRIIEAVTRRSLAPRAILLTHGHLDHIGAVAALKDEYGIPLLIGRGEEVLLNNPVANGSAAFGSPMTAPSADRLLADDDLVVFGAIALRVLATPGHSPAGICYLDEANGWLFCGDTLFKQSIGRTDLYGASLEELMKSIQTRILSLPDSVTCFPGHGPRTTVGAERVNNPFLTGEYFV